MSAENLSLQYTQDRALELIANAGEIAAQVNEVSKRVDNGKSAKLVCVSKLKPASDIQALYDAGYRHFGENYVQELIEKSKVLPKDIKWHFIGGLQTNKCKDLAKNIDNLYAVETIDSIKKLNKLNDQRSQTEFPVINIYIQVNTSGEELKSGCPPGEVVELATFIKEKCPKLNLEGLMTIGSIANSKSDAENEDFKTLVKCASEVESLLGGTLQLSMGMSSDFEEAIRQGSTSVRVGSNIFGSRPPNNGH